MSLLVSRSLRVGPARRVRWGGSQRACDQTRRNISEAALKQRKGKSRPALLWFGKSTWHVVPP